MKSTSRYKRRKAVREPRDPNRPLRFNFFHTNYEVVLRVAAQKYADHEDPNPLPNELPKELVPYDAVDRKTDIVWIDRTPTYDFFQRREAWTLPKRISRFPQFKKLCTKSILFHSLNRLRFFFPADFDFYPKTFILPNERDDFLKHKALKRSIWIAKPSSGCEGRGITVQSVSQMKKSVHRGKSIDVDSVVQEYIDNPFLLNGYKFDMRVFVLITSLDPLEMYLYENGLVRQATEKYKSSTHLHNHYMHLTNSSINKHNSVPYKELDCKKDFRFLNDYLLKQGYKPAKLWSDIEDIIMKTLISIRPHGCLYYNHSFPTTRDHHARNTQNRCFHIIGFDVIIRQSPDYILKPYLLEINNQPSLRMDTPTDYIVKENLIRDTFQLITDQLVQNIVSEEEDSEQTSTYGFKKLEFREVHNIVDIFSRKKLRRIFVRACGVRNRESRLGRLEISGTKLVSFIRQSGILRKRRRRSSAASPQIDIMFAELSRKYAKKYMDFNDFLDLIVAFTKKLYLTGKNRSPYNALYTFFQRHFND